MKKKIIILIVSVLCIGCLGFMIYVNDYYHANSEAITAMKVQDDIEVIDEKDHMIFKPQNIKAGFIFYPGGKVETKAYAPLMKKCAENDILCILVKMPFQLAVFNIEAAFDLQKKYSHIDRWYLGGHSLGGAMAASYIADHSHEFNGLILLASYSTADLSDSNLKVLSIYGSEDRVLNKDKYEENIDHFPKDFKEEIIAGGNHAYFGSYGMQDGDGKAKISNAEQIEKTAILINRFMD